MEQLLTTVGFDLNLKPYVPKSPARRLLRVWGIPYRGLPIASVPGTSAALWYGRRFNADDETISFIAAVPEGAPRPGILYADCYFGVVGRSALEASTSKLSTYADAARHPCRSVLDYDIRFLMEVLRDYVRPPNNLALPTASASSSASTSREAATARKT